MADRPSALPATAAQLVARYAGELAGDGDVTVARVATLDVAGPDCLAFCGNARYRGKLSATRAGVVVLPVQFSDWHAGTRIIVDNPRAYVARILDDLDGARRFAPGVDASAQISPAAQLGADVHIGPGAVVEAGARIGAGTAVLARAVVTADCQIGANCILHEGCVIGAEGFGFISAASGHTRIKHQGRVVVGDNVEVGANTCIDRGVIGDTVIGAGTKIDNLVQIAHNVRIGENCIVCGCAAIAGSAEIGSGCVLGGATRITDHARLAERVMLQGGTIVVKDIKEPDSIHGSLLPNMSIKALRRVWRHVLRIGGGAK